MSIVFDFTSIKSRMDTFGFEYIIPKTEPTVDPQPMVLRVNLPSKDWSNLKFEEYVKSLRKRPNIWLTLRDNPSIWIIDPTKMEP